jgi:histone arginine demethylase JMJD6
MSVERRRKLSLDEFEQEYVNKLKPVIIEDVAQSWPAFSKWSPSYFREVLGDKPVLVDGELMLMREFMNAVEVSTPQAPSKYLTGTSIPRFFPELLADIQTDLHYAGGSYLRNPFLVERLRHLIDISEEYGLLELLVCGAGGVFPNLHYDAYHLHAFVVQICGTKEFTLYPPEQTPYLYPNPRQRNTSLMGDMRKVDPLKFPEFAKARPERVVVEPGEMIFVPSGWWHTTRMLSHSIAVTANSLTEVNLDGFFDDAVSAGHLKHHEKQRLAEIDECIF